MKFKTLFFVSLLITITTTVFARPTRDSIGVENNNGKKVILHKLDAKDNYYSLGRRYNVSPKDIMAFNNNAPLIIGNVVKIPTNRPFLESSYNTPQPPKPAPQQQVTKPAPAPQQAPVQQAPVVQQPPAQQPQQQQQQTTIDYKVSVGETLYSIAKRFSTTVAAIQQANGMDNSTTLTPGQIIKVPQTGSATPPVQPPVVAKQDNTATTPAAAIDSANANKFNSNRYGLYEKDEKGVATWMDSSGLDPNKKLVLHRTAPIGTVIKITNPMTNLTTYAKVVGKFTDNEDNKDVIIVVTKNVAESIGAQDKRFRVTISYGSPNE
jgi:LysM repeat protein